MHPPSHPPWHTSIHTLALTHSHHLNPLPLTLHPLHPPPPRAQAYVGAFLRKPDAVIAAEKAKRAAAASGRGEDGSSSSSSGALGAAGAGGEGEVEDPAAHLYEIGTFAQVGQVGLVRGGLHSKREVGVGHRQRL
jgi:hypothetical protein